MQNKFDYGFYQEELWEYVKSREKSIIEYEMQDVKHWVYAPCWSYQNQSESECFISIYQVMLQPEQFADHAQRIREADIQYPLIVIEDEFDKYGVILDGNHRFANLLLKRTQKVSIQLITRAELMLHLYRKI